MFTVMIADDHPLFRAALCQVIAGLFSPHRILEASTLAEAHAVIAGDADADPAEHDLDMILLDLQMPGSVGFSGLLELRNAVPAVPIVIVSAADAPTIMRDAITYGAAGFIPKSLSPERIGDALRLVMTGAVYLPDDGTAGAPDGKLHDRLAALTQGELRVFELLAKGKSNKIIAYELGIKESTVKAHITAILRKLHVFSRTQAVIAARELNLS